MRERELGESGSYTVSVQILTIWRVVPRSEEVALGGRKRWYALGKHTTNDINVRCIGECRHPLCSLSLILPFLKHLLHSLWNVSFPNSET